MFSKIVIALNDQPESQRAFRSATNLAHAENAKLAQERGVHATDAIVEGREAHAILGFLNKVYADLLVIGPHQHDICLSRPWSSVYDLAQNATCSVLGVH